MEVSSTMRRVHVIVLSLITLVTDVKVCVGDMCVWFVVYVWCIDVKV